MTAERSFDVSIVITSFNHEAFLIEAIESVLSQTVMPREILIADDGSTDGSVRTIDAFARRHPGLIVPVIHENRGIPRNRNSALQRAVGAYVGVLDGDDRFRPDKLERQRDALRRAPESVVVYGNFCKFDDDGRTVGLRYSVPQREGDVLFEIADLNFGVMRTMIAKSDAVRAAGLMDPRLPKYDGLWLSIQLAATGPFAYVDEVLVEKRVHDGNDSRLNLEQDARDLSTIYDRVKALTAHLPAERRAHLEDRWRRAINARRRT
ncbi:MAG: glycosyltransferase family 2 protein [Oceanicaulis sp.]